MNWEGSCRDWELVLLQEPFKDGKNAVLVICCTCITSNNSSGYDIDTLY